MGPAAAGGWLRRPGRLRGPVTAGPGPPLQRHIPDSLEADMPQPIHLDVNGNQHLLAVEPERRLLSVLRDDLGLLGARLGCGEGECGACTVLADGEPVRSCVTTMAEVAGRRVTTVEGLSPQGRLHPVARAFVEEGALQCGFCTAGMIVSAVALLERNHHPYETEIREAMEGNVCRCGTYPRILRAVHRAAATLARDGARSQTSEGPFSDGVASGAAPMVRSPLEAGWMPRPDAPWDMTEPRRRDYFGALGDGLVVVLPPREAARNLPDQPGPWHGNGGAWIHVGANEQATAFTGKVDFGQDNRTALALIVAEELGMPLAAVRLVMGDTDVCPYDVGTWGSRSMADAGAYLRAVAAHARASLLEMGARHLGVDVPDLRLADCRVAAPGGTSAVRLRALLQGERLVEDARMDAATPSAMGAAQTGAPERHGPADPVTDGGPHGAAKITAVNVVTGMARYTSDMARPGMLHGRVLRAPAFGSTLRSLDTSAAAAMPGITVVRDGSFIGVTAPAVPLAARALSAIRAEWDEAPQPSEREIVGYLRAHPVRGEGWEGGSIEHAGDVEGALATASARIDATYTSAYIAHVPLETRVAIAEWTGPRLTVWTGTQVPFGVREQLAAELGVPAKDVRVVVGDTGGGWGGKHSGEVAVEAARLARSVGRPVKVRWTREEESTWGYFRPYAVIDVRSGARRDGTLTAWDFTNIDSGSAALATPYEVANRHVEYRPAASPLRVGSYRALAATANTFARESHMDELAARVGVDPLEFRLRNLRDERLAAVLTAAAERAGWGRRTEPGLGRGIACAREKWARIATVAEVSVAGDGRLRVLRITSAYDCGRVVNPEGLVNQIEGATVMGLGGALFEAVHFEDGRILNPRLSQYRVPRFSDVPPIEVVLIDRPDLPSAGGGEVPIVAVAPAIANAIVAASGIRVRSMPLAPDGVVG